MRNIQVLLFRTNSSWSPLILRVLMSIVVFPHGAQKLFGLFGGYGFTGTMNYFTETLGIPWVLGFMAIILETFGVVALLFGFATRILAISFFFLALTIMFTVHFEHGFFMNWYGNKAGEGYEYFLLWIAMILVLIVMGGGNYSIDKLLFKKKKDSLKIVF
ncbi:DoxX family protein [Gaetbulibacter sp. M235]|uniref:DoxX family protein n=1 Tax=Gaetbulibacter sp. M235 TaxID=3126510 RepID=UPI00374EE009